MSNNPVVVDLSHWQADPIDFEAMREAGTRGVILKCTEGQDYVDPTFAERAVAARMAGLMVAAYHYLHHEDVVRQMAWFFEHYGPDPGEQMVIDFEDPDCTLADLVGAVDYLLQATECQVTVYGASFLFDTVATEFPDPLQLTGLWAARYSSHEPEISGWSRYDLWQYTDKAECTGVGSLVDGNRWNEDAGTYPMEDWFYDPQYRKPDRVVAQPVEISINLPPGVGLEIYVNGDWWSGRAP